MRAHGSCTEATWLRIAARRYGCNAACAPRTRRAAGLPRWAARACDSRRSGVWTVVASARCSASRPSASLCLVAMLTLAAVTAPGARAASDDEPVKKVTLCHKEGGPQYVRINVAVEAAINGHAKNHPLDIIPPFTYKDGKDTKNFPGQNWDAAGQAIWENGCVAPPTQEPIDVFVDCVIAGADGSFTARFGYESENTVERTVRVGAANLMAPGAQDRGQTTAFAPGRVQEAFTVAGVTGPLTWTVTFDGRTSSATATATSPACEQPPPGRPGIAVFATCVTNHADGTYDATFGYENTGPLPVAIPAGADNAFSPAPVDRGQSTVFLPVRVGKAFTVKGVPGSTELEWTLKSDRTRTANASAEFQTKCDEPPPPAQGIGIFVKCVQNHADGTYDATFGYDNPNAQPVEIPVTEENNRFSPAPRDRGQVTLFEAGNAQEAFTVKGIARIDGARLDPRLPGHTHGDRERTVPTEVRRRAARFHTDRRLRAVRAAQRRRDV